MDIKALTENIDTVVTKLEQTLKEESKNLESQSMSRLPWDSGKVI